jgi:hypothetical protein
MLLFFFVRTQFSSSLVAPRYRLVSIRRYGRRTLTVASLFAMDPLLLIPFD